MLLSVCACSCMCMCVVSVLSEGGHRGLVVECQDAPLTKGAIRVKLLLPWYPAHTVSHRVSSHTRKICVHGRLHTQWRMENHAVTMFIVKNHQMQWYHQKDLLITPPSVICVYHLNYMGDGFSNICTHHIHTAILSLGKG